MSFRVRIVVPARDEEARLAALLASVSRALAVARELGARWRSDLIVVTDRCRDQTARVASAGGAQVLDCPAPHGKVEALRAGLSHDADVNVCIDADVVLGARTLFDLVETLRSDPSALAACPPLAPLPLVRPATPLAWALHRYNAARGFSSERLWLSGRCYALRFVAFPTPAELAARARARAALDPALHAPLQADDVWLSRFLLAQRAQAIRHVDTDPVHYRAPNSWRGMSRSYRRLRRELRRIDRLFPELPGPGRDRQLDSLHGARDRLAYAIFQLALAGCRAHASFEDAAQRWFAREPDAWPVVEESKL
jgi:glycosyltransferase involved in cell wall biosynthesis